LNVSVEFVHFSIPTVSVLFPCGKCSLRSFDKAVILTFQSRLAYLVFDGIIALVVSVFITAVFGVAVPAAWWNLTFVWLCLFLYGLASILLSYVISLIAKSQLSAFAFSAGGQA
jgi:membrane-associated HD superfamily phosphohydrolase